MDKSKNLNKKIRDAEYKTIISKIKTEPPMIIQAPTKILLVEDGSVDIDTLESELLDMGIKVIVYRQGSQKPELINLKEKTNE